MRLGISSYTFNWWCGRVPNSPDPPNPLRPSQLLQLAVDYGVTVVQICDNLPLHLLTSTELQALADQARRSAITIETGTRGLDSLPHYLEISKALRAPLLRTLLPGVTEDEAVGRMREIIPNFERAGVILGIENHDSLPARTLRRIVDRIGSPGLGVCLDTANSMGCGEDIRTTMELLAEVTVNLHLKDFTTRRFPHSKGIILTGAPAGRGLIDIPWVLDRLRKSGRDVNCILELWSEPEDTIAASIQKENDWAAESLRYLRQFIA